MKETKKVNKVVEVVLVKTRKKVPINICLETNICWDRAHSYCGVLYPPVSYVDTTEGEMGGSPGELSEELVT